MAAICGVFYYGGMLQGQINALDPNAIKEAQEKAMYDMEGKKAKILIDIDKANAGVSITGDLRGRDVQVQTGTVEIHKDKMGGLWDVRDSHCPRGREGQRGELSGRADFPEPFLSPPQVLLALSALDFASGRNLRIHAIVSKVDEAGFDYLLYTWCNTKVWWVRASWIAVAKSDGGGQ